MFCTSATIYKSTHKTSGIYCPQPIIISGKKVSKRFSQNYHESKRAFLNPLNFKILMGLAKFKQEAHFKLILFTF